MLSEKIKFSGIEVINELKWGMNFCYFYLAKDDLIDILMPYFKQGLEKNDYCLWVVSDDISKKEAIESLNKNLSNAKNHLKQKKIEIINYKNWYIKNKKLDFKNAFILFKDKFNYALKNGYDGLRVSVDLRWLKKKDLEQFIEYESKLDNLIHDTNILAIYSYPINKYIKSDVLSIANGHRFSLFKRNGSYKVIENSERKKLEHEREVFQLKLDNMQKSENIGLLSSQIAHDFNNLLSVIKGYTDLALMRLDEDTENVNINSYLKEISTSVKSAANLIQRLLDFNRDLKPDQEYQEINVNDNIYKLLEMLSYFIVNKIAIAKNLDEELWTIKANPEKIEQILLNLIMNARDAMPNGGELIIKTNNIAIDKSQKEKLQFRNGNRYICISVEDNGTGMDEKTMKRIFEPFFTTKELGKGTGLGLSIVQNFVKEHKGWIDVSSKPNQGTIFNIYLPANSS